MNLNPCSLQNHTLFLLCSLVLFIVVRADIPEDTGRTLEWLGYPSLLPEPKVVGGQNVSDASRFPYFVALVDDSERIVCGGSLIAADIVLTAAHCDLVPLKYAIVGKYTSQIDAATNNEETISIAKTVINPKFSLRNRDQDQMLVHLTRTAQSSSYVKVNFDRSLPSSSDRVTVVGLGQTYTSTEPATDPPEVLQQVEMDIVPNSECQSMYDQYMYFLPSIREDMMCLLEPSMGQCYGDSGGPYLLLGKTARDDLQVGTVAWGIECGSSQYPAIGIKTSMSSDDFIRSRTCELSIDPPAYFGCNPNVPNPGSETPTMRGSQPPSSQPSVRSSSSPSVRPSMGESQLPSVQPSLSPSNAPSESQRSSIPSSEPTRLCILGSNACGLADTCCGSAVCEGGFCRKLATDATDKDDWKVSRGTSTGTIRGASTEFTSPLEP